MGRTLSQYWTYGYPDQLAWLKEILQFMIPDPMVKTDAPSFVELSLRRKSSTLLLHLINGNPGRDISHIRSEDWWVDDIPSVGPYAFRIKCANKPAKVTWEPGSRPLEWSWRGGKLQVTVPRLEIHGCIAVEPLKLS